MVLVTFLCCCLKSSFFLSNHASLAPHDAFFCSISAWAANNPGPVTSPLYVQVDHYQKQGVQGFKILYWLSSCDDKDNDKDKDKDKILCIIGAEYFSGVNIFQE